MQINWANNDPEWTFSDNKSKNPIFLESSSFGSCTINDEENNLNFFFELFYICYIWLWMWVFDVNN